jgi:hypothetical protein
MDNSRQPHWQDCRHHVNSIQPTRRNAEMGIVAGGSHKGEIMPKDSQDDRLHMSSPPTRDEFTAVGLCHAAWVGWHYETESEAKNTH